MGFAAISLVLLSGVLHAFRDFNSKKSIDKPVFMWLYMTTSLLLFIPLFLYFLFNQKASYIGLSIAIASAAIHTLYRIFLAKAYHHGDFSHVYPIARSSPALVMIFALVFLSEQVSLMGAIGIFAVTFGVYTINMKSFSLKDVLEPIKSITKEKAMQFAFLTLLTVAGYSIVDNLGVRHIHPVSFLFFLNIFSIVYFTPYVLRIRKLGDFKKEWKRNKANVLMAGIFSKLSYGLILIAFTFANVSYVVALRQISVVIAVMLGSHVLQERHKLLRLTSSIIIFIGIFLISIT